MIKISRFALKHNVQHANLSSSFVPQVNISFAEKRTCSCSSTFDDAACVEGDHAMFSMGLRDTAAAIHARSVNVALTA